MLSFVNETLYSLDSFTIQCYDSNAIQYQTDVTADSYGTLTFNVIAEPMSEDYNQAFGIKIYDNRLVTSGSWFPSMTGERIHINFVEKPIVTPSNSSGGFFVEPLNIAMIAVF